MVSTATRTYCSRDTHTHTRAHCWTSSARGSSTHAHETDAQNAGKQKKHTWKHTQNKHTHTQKTHSQNTPTDRKTPKTHTKHTITQGKCTHTHTPWPGRLVRRCPGTRWFRRHRWCWSSCAAVPTSSPPHPLRQRGRGGGPRPARSVPPADDRSSICRGGGGGVALFSLKTRNPNNPFFFLTVPLGSECPLHSGLVSLVSPTRHLP